MTAAPIKNQGEAKNDTPGPELVDFALTVTTNTALVVRPPLESVTVTVTLNVPVAEGTHISVLESLDMQPVGNPFHW